MRACHILLGKPWLFYQKVQYDGYRKIYSFLYKGKKLVLKLMKVQEFEQLVGENHIFEGCVLTLRKFTTACMEQGLFIALVAHPGAPALACYPFPTELRPFCNNSRMSCLMSYNANYFR
jgi:hypothetical protein